MDAEQQIEITGEEGIIIARQTARDLARSLGFGMLDQGRIATAVSELTRNVVRYANYGSGTVSIRTIQDSARVGLEIVVSDTGPGIPDVSLAMGEGFSTGHGLGMGLPGAKRLVDEMEIITEAGKGTCITIRKWRR